MSRYNNRHYNVELQMQPIPLGDDNRVVNRTQAEAPIGSSASQDGVTLLIIDESMHEHYQVKNANGIVVKLSKVLQLFVAATVYVTAVQCWLLITYLYQGLGDQYYQSWYYFNQNPTLPYVFAVAVAASSITMEGVLATITLNTAHQLRLAARVAVTKKARATSDHLEKSILYLTAIFNTFAAFTMIKALIELTTAAAMLPILIVVVAVTALMVAIFWLAGFLALQAWQPHRSIGSGLVDLLSAQPHVIARVPSFIKLWMSQVFGRVSLMVKDDSDNPDTLYDFQLWLDHYKDVVFTHKQFHVLKLLPEAMGHTCSSLCYKVYASALLLATDLISKAWSQAVVHSLDIFKAGTALALVLTGSNIFRRSMRQKSDDMQNLIHGLDCLKSIFLRLSVMLILTATLQTVPDILKMNGTL